ncbi:MAG TPA: c-type cytochrome [Burkholderiaceae bacterium]|nr:c-type cytochrome [Burkholderiaceae bacterium]
MKRIPLEFAILAVAAAVTVAVALPAHAQNPVEGADKLARGKYLVTTSGCNDCHTPWKMGPKGPEPDMSRMLSGHPEDMVLPPAPQPQGPWIVSAAATNTAWSGPWGVSFTANLTPDAETGLGKWTQRNFSETIRTGRHMGRGRQILPPMPIPMYKSFTDADLEAIFSYLQSIPAVKNRVPEPLPPAAPVAMK